MAEIKTRDERHKVSKKRGNGQLRREVWQDETGRVTHYNLTYVNHLIYPNDNGRVLGFDDENGVHHRHFMGQVEPVEFTSFSLLEARFEREWTEILQKRGKK